MRGVSLSEYSKELIRELLELIKRIDKAKTINGKDRDDLQYISTMYICGNGVKNKSSKILGNMIRKSEDGNSDFHKEREYFEQLLKE